MTLRHWYLTLSTHESPQFTSILHKETITSCLLNILLLQKCIKKNILPAKQEPWAPNFEWNSSSKGSRPVELLSFLRVFYHTSNKWPLRCQTICQCVEGRHQIRIQFTIWESFRREKDCPLKVKYEEKLAEKWWRSWKMLQRRALENMVSFQHGEKGHSSRNPHGLTKKRVGRAATAPSLGSNLYLRTTPGFQISHRGWVLLKCIWMVLY